ncbi:MAG: D-alanine--D-alanine ligase family protein [bacterium]
MSTKINLGILFGGRSCEHEVSVVSARSVLEAIDREKYNVFLIGIDKQGKWHLGSDMKQLVSEKAVSALPLSQDTPSGSREVSLDLYYQGNLAPTLNQDSGTPRLDVIFPVLHGTFGEDGTIQGVFEMAGIPYVGCGVAASAIAMDKALAKQVFSAANIPQAPCIIITRTEWNTGSEAINLQIEDTLGYPIFVKPANMGSSVGVSKASDQDSLIKAIQTAFEYDNKIVVEQSMENCHEVECAVLGNQDPIASQVGEIIPGAEFYDYQTKYIDDKTETLIPATISDAAAKNVQELSVKAFKAIDGTGLSRVDFFVHRESQEVYLNEINTLPGFTPISMYPKMWAASGVPYDELIDRLVELAIEQHRSRAALKRSF